MNRKIISIVDLRRTARLVHTISDAETSEGMLLDSLDRPLQDLRISVTDQCNFRCTYCMPKSVFSKDFRFLSQNEILSFEEIVRIAMLFIAHGVKKIRLTGGEPLLRKNLEKLIARLSALKASDGSELDIALTTNGVLLAKKAQALRDAGLRRVTVSLDAIDDELFQQISGVDCSVSDVLRGIDTANRVGFSGTKVNMVVKAGLNDHQIVEMARLFKGTPTVVRFIEYMDVGTSNNWQINEVISSTEVVRRINAEMPLTKLPQIGSDTAARWGYSDGTGEIGVISSISQAFCRDCSRARLSTDGKIYTCLFATTGHDLKFLLREGKSDAELSSVITQLWKRRSDRYSELRSTNHNLNSTQKKVEMSYIGG